MKKAMILPIALVFLFSIHSLSENRYVDSLNSAIAKIDAVGIERYDKVITRGEAIVLLANAIGLSSAYLEHRWIETEHQFYVEQFSFYGSQHILHMASKLIFFGRANTNRTGVNDYLNPPYILDPWSQLTLEEGVTLFIKVWIPAGEKIDLTSGYEKALEIGLINENDEFNRGTKTKLTIGDYYIILSRFLDLKCNPDKSFFANVDRPEDYTYFELLSMQNKTNMQ